MSHNNLYNRLGYSSGWQPNTQIKCANFNILASQMGTVMPSETRHVWVNSFAFYIRLSIDLDVFFCISSVQTDKQKLKSDWICWLKQNQIQQIYRSLCNILTPLKTDMSDARKIQMVVLLLWNDEENVQRPTAPAVTCLLDRQAFGQFWLKQNDFGLPKDKNSSFYCKIHQNVSP